MKQNLAFVFPGQGSQQVGMLSDLATRYGVIQDTFEQASAALGYDLWALCQQGPEADLNSTDKTQPALLTAGVALWRLWCTEGGARPAQMSGHSLGEYTALVCAGAISLEDGVRLVRLRGEAMQQAVPVGAGAMAAVLGLDDDKVEAACAEASVLGVVAAVNYNSPGQVVIAGATAAVAKAAELCKAAGAKRAMELPVSVPSHCALMRPAADKLADALEKIEVIMPQCMVIQNVSASAQDSVAAIKQNLVEQLYSPVQWTRCVESMVAAGADTMIECGPGKVLSGLNKRIQRSLSVVSISEQAGLDSVLGQ